MQNLDTTTNQLVGDSQATNQLVGGLQTTNQLVGGLQVTNQLVGVLQISNQLVPGPRGSLGPGPLGIPWARAPGEPLDPGPRGTLGPGPQGNHLINLIKQCNPSTQSSKSVYLCQKCVTVVKNRAGTFFGQVFRAHFQSVFFENCSHFGWVRRFPLLLTLCARRHEKRTHQA